jgi:hypothetical protein
MIFTLVKAHRIFTKIWDTPLALRVPYFGKALVLGGFTLHIQGRDLVFRVRVRVKELTEIGRVLDNSINNGISIEKCELSTTELRAKLIDKSFEADVE